MARQRMPSNEQYVRRLAECLASMRHTLRLIEETRDMPRAGFERMMRLAYPNSDRASDAEYIDDILDDLAGLGWALMVAEGAVECRVPHDVQELADALRVVTRNDAPAGNRNLAPAEGAA